MVGSKEDSERTRAARDFTRAWERGDLAAMHRLLSPDAQRRFPRDSFARAYEDAAATATLGRLEAGSPDEDAGSVRVPIELRTRVFGLLRGDLRLPVDAEG